MTWSTRCDTITLLTRVLDCRARSTWLVRFGGLNAPPISESTVLKSLPDGGLSCVVDFCVLSCGLQTVAAILQTPVVLLLLCLGLSVIPISIALCVLWLLFTLMCLHPVARFIGKLLYGTVFGAFWVIESTNKVVSSMDKLSFLKVCRRSASRPLDTKRLTPRL